MATIANLVFNMEANIARLQEDMAKATTTVDTAMKGIEGAVSTAKTALKALGLAATIDGFVSMVHGSIQAMNALHELSLRTGTTVETLSALRSVAKQSGTDMDSVAMATQRLARAMVEASDSGTGKAAGAFNELGIQLTDATGKMRPAQQVMQELAVKLTDMGDRTRALALAQETMGKSGANLMPFLAQLAEAGQLTAKVTTEQAEAAHRFEVNLTKLQGSANSLKIGLANELLPALNDITEAMIRGKKEGGLLQAVIEGIKTAATGTDRNKNDRELVDLTERKLALEQQLQRMKSAAPDERENPVAITRLENELRAIEERLKTTLAYRRLLEQEEAAAEAKKRKPGQGAESSGRPAVGTDLPGLSPHDLEIYRMLREAAHEQEAADRAAAKSREEAQKAAERYQATMEGLAEAERRAIDPTRVLNQELASVAQLVNEGFLGAEEGDRRIEQISREITKIQEAAEAQDKLKNKAVTASDEMIKAIEGWGRSFSREMAVAVTTFDYSTARMKGLFFNLLQEIVSAQINKRMTQPLISAAGGILDKILGVPGATQSPAPAEEIDISTGARTSLPASVGAPNITQHITVGGSVTEADIPRIVESARQGAIAGVMEMQSRGAMA